MKIPKEDELWIDTHIEKKLRFTNEVAVRQLREQYRKYRNIQSIMKYITDDLLLMSVDNVVRIISETESYIKEKAKGVDGITRSNLYSNRFHYVEKISRNLKQRYKMKPVRRVKIKELKLVEEEVVIKERPLSILCAEDMVLQDAIVGLLSPVIEEILTEETFGYRNNIGAIQAIEYLEHNIKKEGIKYILQLDIKSFFDSVNIDKLIKILKEIVKDKKLIAIIRNMLYVDYQKEYLRYSKGNSLPELIMKKHKTKVGICQGAPISPILANLYLHKVMDSWYKNIETKDKVSMSRYADDIVVMFRNKEDLNLAYKKLEDRFRKYDLTLSKEKTNIIDIEKEEIEYLGMEIIKEEGRLIRRIPKSKIVKAKMKAKEILEKSVKEISNINRYDRNFFKEYVTKINNRFWGKYRTYSTCENIRDLDEVYEYEKELVRDKWEPYLSKTEMEFILSKLCNRIDIMWEMEKRKNHW